MSNYYEILKVAPDASKQEIEYVIDEQYNRWRRLVTHHDSSIVNQANQALGTLNIIRDTLLVTEKRSIYDAGIGIGGAVGGLADPNELLKSFPFGVNPQPSAKVPQKLARTSNEDNLWACSKCGAINPDLSMSCFKCGTQLMRECPECREKRSLIKTGICGNCGYKFEIASQRQEILYQIKELDQHLQGVYNEINRESSIDIKDSGFLAFIVIIFFLVGVPMFIMGLSGSDSKLIFIGIFSIFLGFVILIGRNLEIGDGKTRKRMALHALNTKKEKLLHSRLKLENDFQQLENS